jgi:hypothetical protein
MIYCVVLLESAASHNSYAAARIIIAATESLSKVSVSNLNGMMYIY